MNFFKYGFLAVLVGMFMVACSDDDKTPNEDEDELVGIVLMAETAKYDGQSVTALDGTIYTIVENTAQDAGIMADYAWYTLEYAQTPEVGEGINVNLKAIEYTQIEKVVDADDVSVSNDGVDVDEVNIDDNGIVTLSLDYIGGKSAHVSELSFDSASYDEEEGTVVLTLVYDVNKDNGTSALSSVAQFSLATIDADIAEGSALVIKYTDIDGQEREIETGFEF